MTQSSFLFANITNKMAKLTSSIGICFVLPVCIKFMKPCRKVIKILFALQQGLRTYAGNLIYGIRLEVNMRDRLAKRIFQCVAASF